MGKCTTSEKEITFSESCNRRVTVSRFKCLNASYSFLFLICFPALARSSNTSFTFAIILCSKSKETDAVLQSDCEWERSYYTVTSFPIVWEVRIASSLKSRTGDEDPFLVGAVHDFVVNLSTKVRAPFVFICFFTLPFPSLPHKNLCGRPKKPEKPQLSD